MIGERTASTKVAAKMGTISPTSKVHMLLSLDLIKSKRTAICLKVDTNCVCPVASKSGVMTKTASFVSVGS